MIRPIEVTDWPWLEEKGWTPSETFAGGFIYCDQFGDPVMAAGAWRMYETHVVAKETWSSPGARQFVFDQLHVAMEQKMHLENVGEAITFFDKVEATCRRLKRLGWQRITKQVWARKVA